MIFFEIKCKTCERLFLRTFKKNFFIINKKYFCSKKCNVVYQNSKRALKGKTKTIVCSICNNQSQVSLFSSSSKCKDCSKLLKKEYRKTNQPIIEKKCLVCEKLFLTKNRNRKYCYKCLKQVLRNAGIKSSQSQKRRSKNELYFDELCRNKFINVSSNKQFFADKFGNLWDADIILHDQKIAVLWNGLWHYKKLKKQHSLKQVQSRDRIKKKVIEQNGYTAYVIKDVGKFNLKFVEEMFLDFVNYIETRKNHVL